MHVHNGAKPHVCDFCPYRTAKRAALRSHVKTMHKEDSVIMEDEREEEELTPPSPPHQHGDCLPASLPSFSLLKSYDESGLNGGDGGSGGGEDRDTASLSPPLTPATEEPFPFSYPAYPSYSTAPLNYSTSPLEYEDRKGGGYAQNQGGYDYYYSHYNYAEEERRRPFSRDFHAYQ